MGSFTLLHRAKSASLATISLPNSMRVWATCLREIAFLEGHLSQDQLETVKFSGLQVFENDEALFFLLQTLCGLKSPVLGETEVLGQFKTYLASLGDDSALKRDPTLIPFLLNTVKEARTRFLSATGSLTYGHIVRRWLKDAGDVVLWGHGSLGKEIYPWIREKAKGVVVRTPRASGENIPFALDAPKGVGAHVIAAPLSDEQVKGLAAHAFVIDLRDRPLATNENIKNLSDLFREIRDLRREREDVVPRCEAYLRRRVVEYLQRQQIRPFGWEDLCG